MNRTLTRAAFGLATDPWRGLYLDTADAGRVNDMARAAIDDQALVQIVGEPGAGKSTALWRALDDHPHMHKESDLIHVQRLDRESRTIADVVSAIYRTLGEPRPTRAEDRDAQLRQVLGRATRDRADGRGRRRLLLLLDDAHHLHWRTVSALKGLRELAWLGRAPLLGVILLSQRDVLSRTAEIRERADTLHLSGPTTDEAATALHRILGERIGAEALAVLSAAPRTWNRLIWHTDHAMSAAVAAGRRQLERADALRAVGASLKDLAAVSTVSLGELATQTSASKSHISRVISGQRTDAALSERLADILLSDTTGTMPSAGACAAGGNR